MQPTQTDLSEREQEILKLVATGASNKEIATKLQISTNTVKVHLRHIFSKIGASSRTEAAMYAVNTGLVTSIPPENLSQIVALPDESTQGVLTTAAEHKTITDLRQIGFWVVVGLGLIGIFLLILWWMQSSQPEVSPTATDIPRWQYLAPLTVPRSGMAATDYENLLYVIGGKTAQGASNLVERYDPIGDVWASVASKPTPVYDVNAVVIAGKIFVPGGRLDSGESTNVLEIYDLGLDEWDLGPPLPVGLSAYALAAYEGKLYLFGGWDGQQYVSSVYSYDPERSTWESLPPMSKARGYFGAAVSGSKIYLIGGFDGEKALDITESFSPDLVGDPDEAWAKGPSLPEGTYAMGVTSLANFIYVIGGIGDQEKEYPALVYNEQSNEWQALQNPPGDVGSSLGIASLGPELYAIGGLVDQSPSASTLGYKAIYSITIPIIVK